MVPYYGLIIKTVRVLIFRNPAKDLAELEMRPIEGGARVTLKYQTAAEVEEIEKRIKEKMEKKP